MIVIIMGVSGCGKTTIGTQLAQEIGTPFFDADDFHPQTNIDKMSNGIALNDDDRLPWLLLLANKIEDWSVQKGGVLACSALKETYRQILSSKVKNIKWVYLNGSHLVIKERIEKRNSHYMSSDLLTSQFNTLEIPSYGIHIDISVEPKEIIKKIVSKLEKHE